MWIKRVIRKVVAIVDVEKHWRGLFINFDGVSPSSSRDDNFMRYSRDPCSILWRLMRIILLKWTLDRNSTRIRHENGDLTLDIRETKVNILVEVAKNLRRFHKIWVVYCKYLSRYSIVSCMKKPVEAFMIDVSWFEDRFF